MNVDVCTAALRERFSNPIRIATLLGFVLFPIPIALVDPRPNSSASFFHPLLAVTLASGILGLEFSSGVLALLFTRPISRRTYALSKWAAVTVATGVLAVAQFLAVVLILRLRHGLFDPEALGPRLAERVVVAAGTSAVLLLFSSLGSGLSDLAVWGLASIAAQTSRTIGFVNHDEFWIRLGDGLQFVVAPGWGMASGTSPAVHVPELLVAASVTAASLGLAVWVLERREITYAEVRV
ncbi:MAG: ABC transporter permease subunit [Thermoanaerobaculia bacterium]|jgi:ABC-type transport system involved in multi-copper enzyme maturation permease subunit